MNYIHNNSIDEKIRIENEKFNHNWIQLNKLDCYQSISKDNLDFDNFDATGFLVVWFKNIDRLIKMLPSKIDFSEYSLLDVGCGSGISTLYFLENYQFKSYFGFDKSKYLICNAEKNKEIFFIDKDLSSKIEFEVCDATNFKIKEKSIVFMFNPFGLKTMEKFFLNNLNFLKKSSSYFLYANDLCISSIGHYGSILARDNIYNLSCIKF
tara:strand:- start:716 stop:1342 length:627 start_codon:yes stop_codon:yes gene_type:complete